jgi:hypothetical protein
MFSSRTHKVLSLWTAVFVLTGCIATPPTYRAVPDWNEKKKSIRTIEVIPAKIVVYEVSAGGGSEKMDEWSLNAKNNVVSAIAKELQETHGLAVKLFSEDGMSKETVSNLKETRALFEAVNISIVTHTYGQPLERFPEKIANFDYSLGNEVKELNTENADAILMVWGIDYAFTAGATTKQIIGALLGAVIQRPTYMSMALIDPNTGSILWYRFTGNAAGLGGFHLRDAESAGVMVKRVLSDFPGESDDHGKPK